MGDLNSDGILNSTDAAIALQLAATCGWDPAADVNNDRPHHLLGRAHDPAGGGWGDEPIRGRCLCGMPLV